LLAYNPFLSIRRALWILAAFRPLVIYTHLSLSLLMLLCFQKKFPAF
jgi:hypothetical protein